MGSLNQVDWENHWRLEGVNKFLNNQQDMRDRGLTEITAGGSKVIAKFLSLAETELSKQLTPRPGKTPIEVDILRHFKPDAVMLLGMRAVMRESATKQLEVAGFSTIAHRVGAEIENEALAITIKQDEQALAKHFSNLYNKLARNNKRGKASKKKTLRSIAISQFSWENWGRQQKGVVGALILNILEKVGFITTMTYYKASANQKKRVIFLSEDVEDYILSFTENLSWLFSTTMPMIEPPVTRVSTTQGGFYTKELSKQTPLVKRRNRELKNLVIPRVNDAINRAQSVAYTLNRDVYNVVIELMSKDIAPSFPSIPTPPLFPFEQDWNRGTASPDDLELFKSYAKEKAIYENDKASIQGRRVSFKSTIDVARELTNQRVRIGVDKFWYTWTLDFRGRMYPATVALSPQGADIDKGLILFNNGKILGKRGERWLAIHGANVYGNDKISLDDRYDWVLNNEEYIITIANDPIGTLSEWGNADKPYQFLAFCFEWKNYREVGQNFRSRLPIAVDGSCNGIQNYSAMLRDPVGAKATNLCDSELPADIYKEVANVLEGKLKDIVAKGEDEFGYASQWLSHGITRKLTKRQVMTLPYGATMYSCKDYTFLYAKENCKALWPTPGEAIKPAGWLTPILWQSIGEVVVKGREAMDWLVQCAAIVSKQGDDIVFHTPLGLPVIFSYRQKSAIEVMINFDGKATSLHTGEYNATPNVAKSKNAIAPNFVHAMDSTHLMMTITEFSGDMLPVHDSYATHACDVDELSHKIRQTFYELYTENDPLLDIKKDLEEISGVELPPPPDKGNFDLKEVLRSTYFFS